MKVCVAGFKSKGRKVSVLGYPELEGNIGILDKEGMAFFFGKNREFFVGNTKSGQIRKFSSPGYLLVNDRDIDLDAIAKACPNGLCNARRKDICYAGINRWDGFQDGICAISWVLYPDGIYFADSDGFGIEDNNEEEVYAIIDSNLDIIEPFRPIKDVAAYLKQLRKNKRDALNKTNQTMNTRIYNLIIIDESGSMHSIRQQAIDSVNETIQTIRAAQKKHEEQEHYVSLVTFNDNVKSVYECVSVNDVSELTAETYRPDCCTALYDAMGMSLNALCKKVGEDVKVLVTVITDGYENASKEYSGKAIKSLVDELKAKGWVFAYIGANHDVEAVASSLSITNTLKFSATCDGTAEMSQKLGNSRTRWFDKIACGFSSPAEDNCDFFDEC